MKDIWDTRLPLKINFLCVYDLGIKVELVSI